MAQVQPLLVNGKQVWIGCSGYNYKHWSGRFYPGDLREKDWLGFYSQHFPTVELNNTFYMLPKETTFEGWYEQSPEGFLFAVKANRFITHMKKLKDPEESIKRLFDRAYLLKEKLGPVLYQLPPRWRYNGERLEEFLKVLPHSIPQVVEVRDPTWLNENFFELLRRFNTAYCIASLPDYRTPAEATSETVYIRFHGEHEMYNYNYRTDELRGWADLIRRFTSEGKTVYAYFNNDPNAWAVYNALELQNILSAG